MSVARYGRVTAGLVIAFVLAVMAAVGYPLIRPAQEPGYAAAGMTAVSVTQPQQVSDQSLQAVVLQEHRIIQAHQQQVTLEVWHAQVIADAKEAKLDAQQAAAAAAAQQQAQQAPPAQSGGTVATSGMSSFEACVIRAESGGDPTAINMGSGASGLYGFLMSTWNSLGLGYTGGWNGGWYGGARTAPVSVQEQGFDILYARDGTAPWAPYDGC